MHFIWKNRIKNIIYNQEHFQEEIDIIINKVKYMSYLNQKTSEVLTELIETASIYNGVEGGN